MRFFASNQTYVIVDIGGNFSDVETGCKLVEAAAKAGVDAIKLQTYRAETICTRDAMFDMENTGKISQYDFFKKYELSEEDHATIFRLAQKLGLDWFSTPSHPEDADMLDRLGVSCYKIGADDASNIPFLENLAQRRKPVILSSGLCVMAEIHQAIDCFLKYGNDKIALLHTVSGYPTHPEHVNLNAMLAMQKEFPDYPVGFSDHTLGTQASLAAATLGARIIERHFTLDKNAEGPDHMLSSTPEEMTELIRQIRHVELLRGTAIKMPYGPEVANRINNRKYLVTIAPVRKGEKFSEKNIWPKRSTQGISPTYWNDIVNKCAAKDLPEGITLSAGDIA